MSPELVWWIEIAAKMATIATLVVVATWAAERSGPLVGALIATLPISAGPAFFLLSLDHEISFVAQAALAGLAINAATMIFCLAYILAARSFGLIVSYGLALAAWFGAVVLIQPVMWSATSAVVLNIAACAVALPIARRFVSVPTVRAIRRWYDIPFRATLVASFVAAVVTVSFHLGPMATGTLAVFPIVLSSLIVILQPRIGGPATAALIAHSLFGLIGFAAATLALHLAVTPFGAPVALSLALAVSVGWNLLLLLVRRRVSQAAAARI